MENSYMINSIQAVPGIDSVRALSSAGLVAYPAPAGNTSYADPGVVVSLGSVSPVPLIYAPASNLIQDNAVQALNTISSNPAYANIATSLYLNAAIFRAQHTSGAVLPDLTRGVQAVAPAHAIYRV